MAWWRREKRSSPENPATSLANPSSWFVDWATGGKSTAGKSVTEESALGLTTVYAAISLLSETVAQLPLVLYRKTQKGREAVLDHPAARAIRRPTQGMTSFRWRELTQGHALAWGNGYNLVTRNAMGEPIGLEPQAPGRSRAEVRNGELVYVFRIGTKEYERPAADVLHIPAFGYDGVMGKSPIRVHREAIGLGLAAQEFGAQFFGNGASLGGVLEHPKSLGKDARTNLKEAWEALKGKGYQGMAVLEEGMKYTRIGIPPEDAQFIETRKFTRSEIAAIYKIPPHMLADLEKSSFNNIQEQSIQFLRFTMMPWLIKWEEELNAKLLNEREQGEYFFKFTVNGLLRGTQEARYSAYNVGLTGGWLSRNEVRAWEDLDQVDGLDEFMAPLNMGKANEPAPNTEPAPDDSQRLLLPFVERIAQSAQTMSTNALTRSAKDPATLTETFSRWLADEKTIATLHRQLEPLARACNDDALPADFTAWLADHWRSELQRGADARVDTLADAARNWITSRIWK